VCPLCPEGPTLGASVAISLPQCHMSRLNQVLDRKGETVIRLMRCNQQWHIFRITESPSSQGLYRRLKPASYCGESKHVSIYTFLIKLIPLQLCQSQEFAAPHPLFHLPMLNHGPFIPQQYSTYSPAPLQPHSTDCSFGRAQMMRWQVTL